MASSDRSEWKARIERALTELKADPSEVMRDTRSTSSAHDAPKSANDACSSH